MTALKNYLDALKPDGLKQIASLCDCSVGHLRNCAYGSRQVSPQLAMKLEIVSGGKIKRQQMRDDAADIWIDIGKKRK